MVVKKCTCDVSFLCVYLCVCAYVVERERRKRERDDTIGMLLISGNAPVCVCVRERRRSCRVCACERDVIVSAHHVCALKRVSGNMQDVSMQSCLV